MTEHRYNELAELQDWRCAICQKRTERPLHVDHDHHSKKVRGLLCLNCNMKLGVYEQFHKLAEEYLARTPDGQ